MTRRGGPGGHRPGHADSYTTAGLSVCVGLGSSREKLGGFCPQSDCGSESATTAPADTFLPMEKAEALHRRGETRPRPLCPSRCTPACFRLRLKLPKLRGWILKLNLQFLPKKKSGQTCCDGTLDVLGDLGL